MKILKHIIFFLWIGVLLPLAGFGQGAQVEFGKNRVQYHDFEWWQYESRNFITYWYRSGQNVGQSAVQLAELDYEEIRSLLEYRINDKIEILVYTDLTDLKQSNIGNEEIFIQTGTTTKIVGNKIFVYFNGDHNQLRQQIREGVSQVFLNHMMFGGNLQEIVQNAVLLNLPTWFTQGLTAYIGKAWDTEMDNRLRDGILSGKYERFSDIIKEDAKFAGHSFWYFIAQNYGKSTVSNLLYLTRINRSIESGFLYVLGNSFEQTTKNWVTFFQKRYSTETAQRLEWEEAKKLGYKNKRNIPISGLKLSPNGRQVAYVSNEIGRFKVYVYDIQKDEQKVIFKGGAKNIFQVPDYNYPIIAWTPDGQKVGIIYERRDIIKLLLYDIGEKTTKTQDFAPRYARILDADFMNSRELLVAAIADGYSDIYRYDVATRSSKQITKDYHDDTEVAFVKIGGRKGLLMTSNRPDSLLIKAKLDTILPLNTFDIFYYDLETKGNKELVRITNTPLANETKPIAINERYFGFLSNQNGIHNRYIGYMDTAFSHNEQVIILKGDGEEIIYHPDSTIKIAAENIDTSFIRAIYKPKGFSYANTNMNRSILVQHTSPRTGQVISAVLNDEKYEFYLDKVNPEHRSNQPMTSFMQQKNRIYTNKPQKDTAVPPVEGKVEVSDSSKTPNVKQPKTDESNPVDTASVNVPETPSTEKQDTGKIDIDNYFFQSEFEDVKPTKPTQPTTVIETEKKKEEKEKQPIVSILAPREKSSAIHKFKRSRITPYRTTFKTSFVTATLDNSTMFGGREPVFGRYQSVDGSPNALENPLFDYPIPSILLMGNVTDLFEDYRITGGMRIPTTFDGIEYFVIFSDLGKRLDKRYAFYRRSMTRIQPTVLTGRLNPSSPIGTYLFDEARNQTVSNIAEVQLKYPLDIFTSVRATITGRTDRQSILANNFLTLEQPILREQRLGIQLEYVYDNTVNVATNIKHGTRYKGYVELQKKFAINSTEDGLDFDLSGGVLAVAGVDARHYQRLDRYSILAGRFSAATSFGSEKILYFLGGVDNWLLPEYNREIPIPTDESYAYQTIATNLRGFNSNIRNGSSFAVANLELRVPVINYLSKNPIRSSFLRNFQVIGFFDVGTAWEGVSPFTDDNPLNTINVGGNDLPISVKVNYFRYPIVAGYGLGVRTTIFGYFIRLDYAWGIETGISQDPKLYLSLGMDF